MFCRRAVLFHEGSEGNDSARGVAQLRLTPGVNQGGKPFRLGGVLMSHDMGDYEYLKVR